MTVQRLLALDPPPLFFLINIIYLVFPSIGGFVLTPPSPCPPLHQRRGYVGDCSASSGGLDVGFGVLSVSLQRMHHLHDSVILRLPGERGLQEQLQQ